MTEVAERLDAAWRAVGAAYLAGHIGNEATLQAWLFGELRSQFPVARVICGMTVPWAAGKRCHPDLLVIDGDRVIVAIEIKLNGTGYPRFEDDVPKLAKLCSPDGPAIIETEWPHGAEGARLAYFSPETLCAFACVAKSDAAVCHLEDIRKKCRDEVPLQFRNLVIEL